MGMYMAIMGILLSRKPSFGKSFMEYFTEGNRRYLTGFLTLILGILFIKGAPTTQSPPFLIYLGALSVFKGIFLLFGTRRRVQSLNQEWYELPVRTRRLWGIFAFAFGVTLLTTLM